MSSIDAHPILGQLNETQRRLSDVTQLQNALTERRDVMERDGKYTTVISGVIGITGLFFMKPLPFYLILALLVIGLPLVWQHLVKEAREFAMSDEEIKAVLAGEDSQSQD